MKNLTINSKIQIVLNVIFLISIIICFILFFTFTNDKNNNANIKGENLKIAFVNSDSLMSNYGLFQDLKNELEDETIKLREDLAQREKSLQNQFIAYQNKAQSGNISYDEAKKTEESITKQQQSLMELSEKYSAQVANKEYEMSLQVLDSVNLVLGIVNKELDCDYILGYTQGAGILYANPKHDITSMVLDILNERYFPKQ